MTGTLVLAFCALFWVNGRGGDAGASLLRSSTDASAEDDSTEVDPLVAVDDQQAMREAPAAPAGELAEIEPPRASRPAYPVPSKLERATLDVLAVWEFTEEPAADQWLGCGHQSARTDAFGRVRFTDLPPGYGGLTNGAGSQTNLKLEPGEVRALTFPIRRQFVIEGQVHDESGAPVSGADVLVCAISNGPSVPLAKTGADGRFGLDGLAGTMYLSARHGLKGVSQTVRITRDDPREEQIKLVVRGGTGALDGVVVAPDDAAISGAYILYEPRRLGAETDPPSDPARTSGYTDEHGAFRMEALRPGPGKLVVRTADHVVDVSEVEIPNGGIAEVLVQLDPGVALTGRVINDATDKPIVQAYVLVGERGAPTYTGAATDERGEFLIERTPVGSAELTVEILGDVVHRQQIQPADWATKELEFRVETSTHSVHGFVVDEEGQPIAGCDVCAEGKGDSSYTVHTDSDGAFRIHNAPQTATALVVYDASGDRLLASLPRALPSVGPVTVVVSQRQLQTGGVRGLAVGTDGKPIADFDVELEFIGGSGWKFMDGLSNGTFGFDEVPAGKHVLLVRGPGGFEFVQTIDVEANETVDLGVLTLQEGSKFRLDLTFDPPLSKSDRVEIYERRISGESGKFWTYLGGAGDAGEPLGPVIPGEVKLVLRGAGVYESLTLQVAPDGETRETLRIERTAPTRITIDYSALDTGAAPPADGEWMSYGQSWRLEDASGRLLRTSYRPRVYIHGQPLTLNGLDPGTEYTLHVTDAEGRSGSATIQGGAAATLPMR